MDDNYTRLAIIFPSFRIDIDWWFQTPEVSGACIQPMQGHKRQKEQ
jgi:hypothetical protein